MGQKQKKERTEGAAGPGRITREQIREVESDLMTAVRFQTERET